MANPFITPPNQKCFSALVDDAVLATGKPGSLVSVVQQMNLTIRETQGLGLFARDLREWELCVVDTTPVTPPPYQVQLMGHHVIWNRPRFFRKLRTVEYRGATNMDSSGNWHRRERIYPDFALPGKIQKSKFEYFYSADDYFVFNGLYCNTEIKLALYRWSQPLSYYAQSGVNTSQFPGGPYDTRLAYYDTLLEQWMYWTGSAYATTTGSTTTDESYRKLSTNWLIADWSTLILSGTKAKVWGSAGDPRGPVEFSLYKALQRELQLTSGYEAEGF